jgi:hypothetical protein
MYGENVSYLSVSNPAARIEEPRMFWEVVRAGEQLSQRDSQKRRYTIL